MDTITPAVPETGVSPVETLTDQRNLLQQWLARLDAVGSEVPDHVTERVRADYQARLRQVTEELAAHREAIVEELASLRAELQSAEATQEEARDALEEARLRHLIGELAPDDWEERRPGLEETLSSAEEEVARVRGEVERLDTLLTEMAVAEAPTTEDEAVEEGTEEDEAAAWEASLVEVAETEADAAGAPEAEDFTPGPDDTIPEWMVPAHEATTEAPAEEPAAEAPVAEDATVEETEGVDLAWLEEIAAPALGGGEAPAEDTTVDDLAFLEELDRAISGSPAAAADPAPPADPDRTLDAGRAGMLLCKECGAINEPQSWYCEICGSEL